MQFASFDLRDPVFACFGHAVSVQIATLENLYGLAPEATRVRAEGERVSLRCERLAWAGQEERAEGGAELDVLRGRDGSLRVRARVRAAGRVRCVKILLRGLESDASIAAPEQTAQAPGRWGCLLAYPGQIPAPVVGIRSGAASLGVRVEDPLLRPKRFALHVEHFGPLAGRGVAEVICEEDATRFGPDFETPELVIEPGGTAEASLAGYLRFAEERLGLAPWAERADVPAWARRIELVTTLHGMHFSGRVFLGYAEMLEVLRFVAARVPGEAVLAYLPGWEGRYYWQYGDHRPDPRLGGEAGFARLCDGARALGIRLMPMFGANCANLRHPAIARLPAAAFLKSATGNRFHGNQPDWDLARAHDTGWQGWFNPGHPAWRAHLASQIRRCCREFGLDAVFLDTVQAWTNDPDHPVLDGLAALVGELRREIPDLLVAGEADYDRLLPLFPLFQRPWWQAPPRWTSRYVRRFGHLCEGEPGGRTGVHELGVFAPPDGAAPDASFIETLAFQDGTLERHREAVEATLRRVAERVSRPDPTTAPPR